MEIAGRLVDGLLLGVEVKMIGYVTLVFPTMDTEKLVLRTGTGGVEKTGALVAAE